MPTILFVLSMCLRGSHLPHKLVAEGRVEEFQQELHANFWKSDYVRDFS